MDQENREQVIEFITQNDLAVIQEGDMFEDIIQNLDLAVLNEISHFLRLEIGGYMMTPIFNNENDNQYNLEVYLFNKRTKRIVKRILHKNLIDTRNLEVVNSSEMKSLF